MRPPCGQPRRFAQTGEKYESGMLSFPSIYGMGAVIDLMLRVGPAAIEARVMELAGKARAMLCGLGAEVNADESQIVTAILPGQDPRALARSLKERRILVSARHGYPWKRYASLANCSQLARLPPPSVKLC